MMKFYSNKRFLALYLAVFFCNVLSAQYKKENTMSQYFENRALWNPAFTSADSSRIHLLHNRGWMGFEGAPKTTIFTGNFLFGSNSSAGLQMISDVSNVIYRTTGLVSYAYRVPFSTHKNLHIGFNLSISSERIDRTKLDPGAYLDPLIVSNINQEPSFDATLGFAYEERRFSIATSLYRLRQMLSNNNNGLSDFQYMRSAVTYQITKPEDDGLQITSLAMASLYRNTKPVFDVGGRFSFKPISAILLYQTTGNLKFGAGLEIDKKTMVNFYFSQGTGSYEVPVQQFEIGMSYAFTKSRKN